VKIKKAVLLPFESKCKNVEVVEVICNNKSLVFIKFWSFSRRSFCK